MGRLCPETTWSWSLRQTSWLPREQKSYASSQLLTTGASQWWSWASLQRSIKPRFRMSCSRTSCGGQRPTKNVRNKKIAREATQRLAKGGQDVLQPPRRQKTKKMRKAKKPVRKNPKRRAKRRTRTWERKRPRKRKKKKRSQSNSRKKRR